MMEIPQVLLQSIEMIKESWGGVEVELISTTMERTAPNTFNKLGQLGVKLKIEGIEIFLTCSLSEDMCVYGQTIVDEFVYKICGDKLKDKLQRELLLFERNKKLIKLYNATI